MTESLLLSEQHDLLLKLTEAQDIRREREADLISEKERYISLARETLEGEMSLAESILEMKDILSDLISKLETSRIAKMAVFAPKQSKRLLQKLKDIWNHIVDRKTLDASDVSELKVSMADAATLFDDAFRAAGNEIIRHQNEVDTLDEEVSGLEERAKGCHLFLNSLPLLIIGSCLLIMVFSKATIRPYKIFEGLRLPGWLDTIYYPPPGFLIVYLVGCVAALFPAIYKIYKLIKRKH